MKIKNALKVAFLTLNTALSCQLAAYSTTQMTQPQLNEEDIFISHVSVHDFCASGIHIAPDYLREKLIVHNYGHGGAALALSWGSAKEAYEFLAMESISGEYMYDFSQVAILGSGIRGLTMANFMLDKGYQVKIYADSFPPYITHDPMGGLWWPSAVSFGESRLQKSSFKRILNESYEHFKELAESDTPEYEGISKKVVYTSDCHHKHVSNRIDELFEDKRHIDITFDKGAHIGAVGYATFHIDPVLYARSLYQRAYDKGAMFICKRFNSTQDLEPLCENVVFNCLGKGSKMLFEDDELDVVRHQTLTLYPQAGVEESFRFYVEDPYNAITLFNLGDRMILGGLYQFGDENVFVCPQQTNYLLQVSTDFFKNTPVRENLNK